MTYLYYVISVNDVVRCILNIRYNGSGFIRCM